MNIIILAGGLGTRLRAVLGEETPKPIAPILGHPFLWHLISYFERFNPQQIIISTGFGAGFIENALNPYSFSCPVVFSVEPTPLGTGGGMRLAFENFHLSDALVVNGDTFFNVDLANLWKAHQDNQTAITLAARYVDNAARYGALSIDHHQLTGFIEKGIEAPGWINGGMYVLSRRFIDQYDVGENFSFEAHLQERTSAGDAISVYETLADFLDIGIPEDYARAEDFLESLTSNLKCNSVE